ncbi:MAG: tetratricopeptide repeat protein, partial [Silvibacterium sp.]
IQLLRPRDTLPHRQLAQLYEQIGQLGDALRELNAALVLEPNNADDWNNLGVLQARAGDTVSARKDFEHALILDPQHAAARANLAHL